MLLQKVLFPAEACNEFGMYFNGVGALAVTKGHEVLVRAGQTLSLDTYFNAFSVGKWKRYTKVRGLQFCFCADDTCTVQVFHARASADNRRIARLRRNENFSFGIDATSEKIRGCIAVAERRIECSQSCVQQGNRKCYSCDIEELPDEGILYATITPVHDARISGMEWRGGAAAGLAQDVRIAVGICTFRREQPVTKNIKGITENIIENRHSCLYGKLEVYVADNGRSIPQDAFASDTVHVFPNVNLGGSAGFARAMMESVFRDTGKQFTHVILMDDDIVLLPDVLERTYLFLRLLKDEYKESVLGAAMFHEDKRYYQHESGALFDGSRYFKVSGRFYDMRRKEFVVMNAAPAAVNYQGWWYCCIPAAVIRRRKLPLPFFIHYDDIEYSLRNGNHELMLLNGICVWHPQFQNKDPVWVTYYNTRNFLILSALYAYTTRTRLAYSLLRLFLYFLLSYRYHDTFLLRRGITDFLRGADFFAGQDALRLHSELASRAYTRQRPQDLGIDMQDYRLHACSGKLLLTMLRQFLCALLPLGGKIKVFDAAACNYMFDARRCYVYDRRTGDGVLYERSVRRFLSELFHVAASLLALLLGFGKARKQYRRRMDECTGIGFWERYLGISHAPPKDSA